jgi:uncharacterized repeat protein (TIGR01451 family)
MQNEMKKFILLLIIVSFHYCHVKAQWVTIPDANFAARLQQLYPSCMNGNQMDTTCGGIFTSILLVSNQNIADLTGLEYFHFLQILHCENNQLTFLPQLPAGLQELHCYNNQLTYLPELPASLIELHCNDNQLTSLPFLPEFLQEASFQNNQIACLPNIPMMPLYFDYSNNPITCFPEYNQFVGTTLPLCLNNDPVNNPNECLGAATISGHLYKDLNQDCAYDSGETGAENVLVKLYNGTNLIASANVMAGFYGFQVSQSGQYSVKLVNQNVPFTLDCSAADSVGVILNLQTPVGNVDFPVDCDGQFRDLGVQSHVVQGWVFPGQTHRLKFDITDDMSWFNLSCDTSLYFGTVTIQVNGPVTYVAPAFNALVPQVNGNTYTYTISDFSTIIPSSFGLQFLTDTTAQSGNQICVHVEISPNPLDADTTNNVYDFCYQVVNSYDPNMKEVYPVNVLPGYDDWFTYTIHFQNTGNAPAFNIRLRDTLDTQLDVNTFEMLGYSHPAVVSLNGNILTVRFNNIMLPDSTTDYDGSMGYFQYRIKPLPNLPNGSQIENTAYIYFDYNAPIITNTTQNNFDITVGQFTLSGNENPIVLFPNPSAGIFYFKDSHNIHAVEVYNLLGEKVFVQGAVNQINLQNQPKGIYLVRVNSSHTLRVVKE